VTVGVEPLDSRSDDVNAEFGIPLGGMEVDVLRLSAQELLAQGWPGVRQGGIRSDDAHWCGRIMPTEHLCSTYACWSAADDDQC
jgi:hypothetical protein